MAATGAVSHGRESACRCPVTHRRTEEESKSTAREREGGEREREREREGERGRGRSRVGIKQRRIPGRGPRQRPIPRGSDSTRRRRRSVATAADATPHGAHPSARPGQARPGPARPGPASRGRRSGAAPSSHSEPTMPGRLISVSRIGAARPCRAPCWLRQLPVPAAARGPGRWRPR